MALSRVLSPIPFTRESFNLSSRVIEIDGVRLNNPHGDIRLKFTLGGDFIYQDSGPGDRTGRGKILASGCKVLVKDSLLDLLELSEFNFETIHMDYRLKNDRLKLIKFKASGPEVEVTATGTGVLKFPP